MLKQKGSSLLEIVIFIAITAIISLSILPQLGKHQKMLTAHQVDYERLHVANYLYPAVIEGVSPPVGVVSDFSPDSALSTYEYLVEVLADEAIVTLRSPNAEVWQYAYKR